MYSLASPAPIRYVVPGTRVIFRLYLIPSGERGGRRPARCHYFTLCWDLSVCRPKEQSGYRLLRRDFCSVRGNVAMHHRCCPTRVPASTSRIWSHGCKILEHLTNNPSSVMSNSCKAQASARLSPVTAISPRMQYIMCCVMETAGDSCKAVSCQSTDVVIA